MSPASSLGNGRLPVGFPTNLTFPSDSAITVLAIAGLIAGDAKEPTANIFLRAAGREMVVQPEEGVLDNVLRFVAGKPEANEIAKQRFAQFAVQGISSGVVLTSPRACTRGQERKRQRNWYGITRHGAVGMRCSSLRFSRITTEGTDFTGRDEKMLECSPTVRHGTHRAFLHYMRFRKMPFTNSNSPCTQRV